MPPTNNFQNINVAGTVLQGAAATLDNHLVRLKEARALVSAVIQGAWSAGTTYATGALVSNGRALYRSKQSGNLDHAPAISPTWWELVLSLDGATGGPVPTHLQFPAGSTPAFTATLGANLTGKTVDFVFEFVTPPVASGGGYDLDLVASNISHSATVVEAATGRVAYQMSAGDTAQPGYYRAQFQVSDGTMYPETGWIEFEIVAELAAVEGSYLYVAYASDASGTGFSLTPDDALPFCALKVSSVVIASPSAGDFAGLWRDLRGPAGTDGDDGLDGDDGTSAYLYLAYASDASGTGFSLTPGSGLYYVALKRTTSPIASPSAGDFTGLWVNLRGPAGTDGEDGLDGDDGAPVYGYVAYASDAIGTGFSLTPGDGLNFFALKLSATEITAPAASDFTGLWRRYAIDDPTPIPADTDDLTEGTANLYFAEARVLATVLTGLSGVLSGDVVAADSLLAAAAKLQNRLKNVENALASPAQALFAEGTIAIANGASSGTLSALALGFTPTRVLLTLSIPSGGTVLTAVVVGDPATTGFAWKLSAAAPATGYKLHYRIT